MIPSFSARRATLPELAAHYAEAGPPRGEIVILVGPPTAPKQTDEAALDAAILAADESRPLKEIAAEIAQNSGQVYGALRSATNVTPRING